MVSSWVFFLKLVLVAKKIRGCEKGREKVLVNLGGFGVFKANWHLDEILPETSGFSV